MMDKLFKCIVCDNITTNKYLGRWVHRSCFDFIAPFVVKKFDVHNYAEVMEKLIIIRNWQKDGFIDIDQHYILLKIINQEIEIVREP